MVAGCPYNVGGESRPKFEVRGKNIHARVVAALDPWQVNVTCSRDGPCFYFRAASSATQRQRPSRQLPSPLVGSNNTNLLKERQGQMTLGADIEVGRSSRLLARFFRYDVSSKTHSYIVGIPSRPSHQNYSTL